MKHIITLSLILISVSPVFAQKVAGTANALHGKVVFIEANPANQYRHLGTITCSPLAPDAFDEMMEHMIVKRMAKEYEDVEFDALIFRPGSGFCKADVIQFFNDPDAKRKRGRRGADETINPKHQESETALRHGVNLFIENNPTVEFSLLGKVEIPQNFRTSNYEELIKEMVRVSKEAYPDCNGIVFTSGTNLRKANVIKLK